MADDKSGRVRTEPDYRRGDFLWLSHPSDWLLRDHLRAALWRAPGEAIHHRSIDVTGTNGVDADVLGCVVEGRRAGKADHAVFRSSIRRAALDADNPCSRGRVDDRATSLLEHQRDLVLHAQEDAAKVDVDDPVPLFLLVIRSRGRLSRLDAGIIKCAVEPPESCGGLFQGG